MHRKDVDHISDHFHDTLVTEKVPSPIPVDSDPNLNDRAEHRR